MQVSIGAVGLLKKGPEHELVTEYCRRFQGLGARLGLKGLDINEIETGKSLPREKRQALEAEQLLAPVNTADTIICLDERGKTLSSRDLARFIETERDGGTSAMWFLIGGADGHGPAVSELIHSSKARTLSFGKATWPHMLVRVMLAEQLYRAATILGKHPYHRD